MSWPGAGLTEFGARVDAAIGCITEIVQQVVIHRKDFAVRGWRVFGGSTCSPISVALS